MLALLAAPIIMAQADQSNSDLAGDPARGRTLFTITYGCYACHGYDAQTGERRLIPIRHTKESFIIFVQNSSLPRMPTYSSVSSEELADIYAYIVSIPVDAPHIDEIPQLKNIRERKLQALDN